MKVITSINNPKVKQWLLYKQRKHRLEDDVFLVEGEHLIMEALHHEMLRELWISDAIDLNFNFDKITVSPQYIIDKLSQVQSKNTMIGLCRIPHLEIKQTKRLFLCENIQDPGNLGTIIRTALAFNFDGIICSHDSVDYTSDKVVRATQGAIFKMPIVLADLETTVADLQVAGTKVVALALDADAKHHLDPVTNMAFILGNEGQGITPNLLAKADAKLMIDIQHIDSLNVAITAGIVAYTYQNKELT
ncbi:MAG: RNA methyltransferase [Erysipelothrix sp.]|nr:RNA methyltransferase [Erysipelothrix sp.]